MAYNLVAQASSDVLSDGSNSVAFASPRSDAHLRPISTEFGKSVVTKQIEESTTNETTDLGLLMMSADTIKTKYDIIDDNDDDDGDGYHLVQSRSLRDDMKNLQADDADQSWRQPYLASTSRPIHSRTGSAAQSLPLRRPKLDLPTPQDCFLNTGQAREGSREQLKSSLCQEGASGGVDYEPHTIPGHPWGSTADTSLPHQSYRQISTTSLSNSLIAVDTVSKSSVPNARAPGGSVPSRSWSYGSDQLGPGVQETNVGRVSPDHDPGLQGIPLVTSCSPPPSVFADQSPTQCLESPNNLGTVAPECSKLEEDRVVNDLKPSTSDSNNIYRQDPSLFVDFDGVHYTRPSQQIPTRQVLESQQAINDAAVPETNPTSLNGPLPDESKVFYPAPVPMILDLPPKLSKLPPNAQRERRRLKALSAMPSAMRKSAAWLKEEERVSSADERENSIAHLNLPPQLRASAFFDRPGIRPQLDIKGASATETLDSMLEAAAYAPVTAFTDHPYSGHLGGDFFGPDRGHRKSSTFAGKNDQRQLHPEISGTDDGYLDSDMKVPRRYSSANMSTPSSSKVDKRQSTRDVDEDEAALAGGEHIPSRMSLEFDGAAHQSAKSQSDETPGEGTKREPDGDSEGEDEEGTEDEMLECSGPPTTLLAELQIRKAQQKRRTRTAARAFPNGMHSTLLELDAVMQVQQKSRKKRHVTLAWEDHEVAGRDDVDDDDIPLGLLAGGRSMQQNMSRTMGLVEKREREDNEPLSKRRARLRGEDLIRPGFGLSDRQRASTMSTFSVRPLADNLLDEQEGETLAQRIQRIKAIRDTAVGVEEGFAKGISSQPGLKTENDIFPSPRVEAEETLGQRRKRLQDEALRNSRHPSADATPLGYGIKTRNSMADILSQYPGRGEIESSSDFGRLAQRAPAAHSQPSLPQQNRSDHAPFLQASFRAHSTNATAYGYPQNASYINGLDSFNQHQSTLYHPPLATQLNGYNETGRALNVTTAGTPLDPKQRDMINRWRQSVAP